MEKPAAGASGKGDGAKTRAVPRVVIVDRHAWYRPVIEEEEFRRIGAEVVVGWAATSPCPEPAMRGRPATESGRVSLSRISSAYVPRTVTTEDEVIRIARDADAILVVGARISRRVMEALPRLRAIGRYGAGVDNIDVRAAAERGIAVVNASGYCAREVADHTVMFMLACSRRLLFLDRQMRNGRWARAEASPMRALHSQILGLVGFGRIGREVARRAHGFGVTMLAYDPSAHAEQAQDAGVTLVGLNELLSRSDFVSVHAPLAETTHHLIGAPELAQMKPTAFLLNTSRGSLVDESALVSALREGRIAGAALDVFEAEPLSASSPLLQQDSILLTPHVAGLSDESQEMLRRNISRAVADALSARSA